MSFTPTGQVPPNSGGGEKLPTSTPPTARYLDWMHGQADLQAPRGIHHRLGTGKFDAARGFILQKLLKLFGLDEEANGDLDAAVRAMIPGYIYGGRVVFTASTTFHKADYPGLRAIRVRVQGGGDGASGNVAGGGAGSSSVSRSGHGGGYSESWLDVDDIASSETVTVGAAGAGGAAGSNAGTRGGASSFGTLVTTSQSSSGAAAGTAGGAIAVGNLATPAAPGTGDIAIGGQPAGISYRGAGTGSVGGNGGSSPLGAGGLGATVSGAASQAAGGDATGYGAGGGAAAANTSGTAQPGGDGSPGIVIVELYY